MSSYDMKNQKTEKKIRDTFIFLMLEKPIDKITVTEICKKAGLNRCTFYLHYQSVEVLLEIIENELLSKMRVLSSHLGKHNIYLSQNKGKKENYALVPCMIYVRENKYYFLALLSGDRRFRENLFTLISSYFYFSLEWYSQSFGDYQDYIINIIVNGVIDSMYLWLKRQDKTPEEFSSFCMRFSDQFPIMQIR